MSAFDTSADASVYDALAAAWAFLQVRACMHAPWSVCAPVSLRPRAIDTVSASCHSVVRARLQLHGWAVVGAVLLTAYVVRSLLAPAVAATRAAASLAAARDPARVAALDAARTRARAAQQAAVEAAAGAAPPRPRVIDKPFELRPAWHDTSPLDPTAHVSRRAGGAPRMARPAPSCGPKGG
jgi:hypothetical protein